MKLMTDKLETLLACLPESPFKQHLREEIEAIESTVRQQDAELVRELVEALEAEIHPDWDCNSYHPKLPAALARAQQWLEDAEPVSPWMPIETAPENTDAPVVVGWVDAEGKEQHCFDYTEDGCWMEWHEHAEHVHMIGGHGVSWTPPYTHWLPLPPMTKAPNAQ